MHDDEGVHGGPDSLGVPLHDFSTNANAAGPCPYAVEALRGADRTCYPDPAYAALRDRLAGFHGVDRARIVVAASGSEFVFRITAAIAAGGRGAVQVPALAFGDYARAVRAHGLELLRAATPAARPPRLAWACEPSSPMGTVVPGLPGDVAASPNGTAWVLDRAYEPLRLEGRSAWPADVLNRVWQLWTPNKALGLTGVRAAYAIAPQGVPEDFLRRVRMLGASWLLGAEGEALLGAWTEAATQAWVGQSLETLRGWKSRQQDLLRGLGWGCIDSVTSFFCAQPVSADFRGDLAQLRAAGIKLRDCASFGLPGHVRLGVLPPASQDALVRAWHGRARRG